jgi:L-methionine (R)-S-oxide reductase
MHELEIPEKASKKEMYEALLPQWQALIQGEADLIANLSNTCAVLREFTGHFWIGFYLVKNDELILGPFQGPVACTRIAFGKGVCGTAWQLMKTLIVKDVDRFPGHIACSATSKSEIVVPVMAGKKVLAVLDIDSSVLNSFDETDKLYLEKMCLVLANKWMQA